MPNNGSCNNMKNSSHVRSRAMPRNKTPEAVDTKKNHKTLLSPGKPKLYSCKTCGIKFPSKYRLNQHTVIHTGDTPFKCSLCNKTFCNKTKLIRHGITHSENRDFTCDYCKRPFNRKDNLAHHIVKIHNPKKKGFTCDRVDCDKTFDSSLLFHKHLTLHFIKEGIWNCKICERDSFESKSDLLKHMKIHKGIRYDSKKKTIPCKHCDKLFYKPSDLERHLVVHTGSRNFPCTYCPVKFGRKDHLERHIVRSHSKLSLVETTKSDSDPAPDIAPLEESKPKEPFDENKGPVINVGTYKVVMLLTPEDIKIEPPDN